MTRFGWHRGTVAESIATALHIETKRDLLAAIRTQFGADADHISANDIDVRFYADTGLPEWPQDWIVTVSGLWGTSGPPQMIGMTDGPLADSAASPQSPA